MAIDRYSDPQPALDRTALPEVIHDAVAEIEDVVGPVRTLAWNERFIGVSFDLVVPLPTRGTVDDIDIRAVEPVLILIDKRDYPRAAPYARADRKNFPADQLPHLNPVGAGQPPALCLHRGSMDDWFAEHSIGEFVERIRSWYRDAASGLLMRDGDVFEPTRLEGATRTMVFSTRAMDRAVHYWWSLTREPGYAFAYGALGGDSRKQTGWDTDLAVTVRPFMMDEPDETLLNSMRDLNVATAELKDFPRATMVIYAWTAPAPVNRYFGRLPTTYGELLAFADGLEIPLRAAIEELLARDAALLKGIPIALGVMRPRNVQRTQSPLEWLCFALLTEDDPKPDDLVFSLAHREPLTPAFARSLSAVTPVRRLDKPLVFGCGAVGSKVALHLARAGFVSQRLVDSAKLTPHHLVRHGLLGDVLGKSKSEGIALAITSMYPGQRDLGTEFVAGSSSDALADPAKMTDRSIIIDATASLAVHNELVTATLPDGLRVCRIEIADQGRLGILAYEGHERNPRLDDLQAHLFDLGRTDAVVCGWLREHFKDQPQFEDIELGVGCSSATLRMADDVVSHHAAAFSRSLRRIADQDRGHLLLVSERLDVSSSRLLTVPPVEVLPVLGRARWSVRMSAAALTSARDQLASNRHKETGGLLVGFVHLKRKIVYVTDALGPSRDSIGTPNRFIRGSRGYPQQIEDIETRTGKIIGYVGEWHTHPRGSTTPSDIDQIALSEIQRGLAPAGVPGVIVIVGPTTITAAMHPE